MGRDRQARRVAAALLAGLLGSLTVAGAGAGEEPSQTPPDTARIRGLPGYEAGLVETQSFPGKAYVLEAGRGKAPPVVLIHGISEHGAHDWDLLIPVLAQERRVIAFDLPGFGRSSREKAAWGPVTYANFVEEIAQERIEGRYDIVAHSMGVSVALEVVMRDPSRVRRLVIVAAAGMLHGQAISNEQLEKMQKGMGALGGMLDPLRNGAFDAMGKLSDDALHSVAVWAAGHSDAAARSAAKIMEHDSSAALDAVRSPTLVVWGKRDEIVSEHAAWAVVSRIRGARYAWMRDVGHVPMTESPKAFNELVVRWFAGDNEVGMPIREVTASTRDASCERQRDPVVFRGVYRKITIDRCSEVTFAGVRAREIDLANSTVVGFDTVVEGDQVAISIYRSRLKLSGGSFIAAVPMKIRGSELNLAGVSFVGTQTGVEAIGTAKILCSLCRVTVGGETDYMHGFYAMRTGQTFSPPIAPQ